MKTINGVSVPDELYTAARAISQRGGRSFLALPDITVLVDMYDREANETRCANCKGGGFIVMSIIVGGPFPSPQTATGGDAKVPSVSTYHDGQWWHMKNKSYNCPRCNQTFRQLTQPKTKTIHL